MEAEISEGIIKFEKEYMGRGPAEAKAYIIEDLILVRLKGILTPAEEQLVRTSEGTHLVKRTRVELLEGARPLLEKIIFEITHCQVKSMHTDISTKNDERIVIFTLDQNLEDKF